ncbi:unnamed protein product [Cyclocybe aegerita]|uniref:PROP1-like PPR domain-containing protein n=1 Tax=Cyclocybe aegerita TaxID=1973307 RepID=A0A8S0XZ18_CYCAE|nr:unnamed protein product [Cyclocybe aegerita]
MFPQLLHTTTRAVAVVQNQTHAFRNVLQLQSSGPSSGSGSGWGNGPGPGSSKFNAGSRFHAGLNNAGRAVTQANVVTSHDGTISQSDETEEFAPRRPPTRRPPQKRQRIRSSSVSLSVTGRNERGEKMGVLQTVQIHARARHAFSPGETLAAAKERLLAESLPRAEPPAPLLVRRNSTSAPLSPLVSPATTSVPLPTPPPEEPIGQTKRAASPNLQEKRPSTPIQPTTQTVTPPPSPQPKDYYTTRLNKLAEFRDGKVIAELIREMVFSSDATPTVEQFNAGLNALIRSRFPGEPLNSIIKLYNAMLDKSVVPNVRTYEHLIQALTIRDWEVQRAIVSLQNRAKQGTLPDRDEVATVETDQARIEQLKTEDNFASAMSLFEGILAIGGRSQLEMATFNRLLRSCAFHCDINAAIHVFAQIEGMRRQPNHIAYQNMILTFSNAGMIQEAEEIFKSYVQVSEAGLLARVGSGDAIRQQQIQVWNSMIEAFFRAGISDKALELVEQMMHSTARNAFASNEIPVITSSTLSTTIAGFILRGDIDDALAWFNRLLEEEEAATSPYHGLDGRAMRPNSVAWHMILEALAQHGRIDELNKLYKILKSVHEQDHIIIRPIDRLVVHRANMNVISTLEDAPALELLHFLLEDINSAPSFPYREKWQMVSDIADQFVSRGLFDIPCNLISNFIVQKLEETRTVKGAMSLQRQVELHHKLISFQEHVYQTAEQGKGELTFAIALTISRLASVLLLKPDLKFAQSFMHAYGRARFLSLVPYDEMSPDDWKVLLRYAAYLEVNGLEGNPDNLPSILDYAFNGLSSLLDDLSSHGVPFDIFDVDVKKHVLDVLETRYSQQGRAEMMSKLGPSYLQASQEYDQIRYSTLENELTQPQEAPLQAEPAQSPVQRFSHLSLNRALSRTLEDLSRCAHQAAAERLQTAYDIFQKNLEKRLVPEINAISHLIQSLGRSNQLDKVRELYTVAQEVFPLLPQDEQIGAWAQIEDSMIIALAHSGHPEAAHVHRMRILEQGQVPSADAYGVLIQFVKDTTDDTNGGMTLFQEALERGVRPNLYLYNNIISKLSKARKADYALELFQQMKGYGIVPSSITYGAVIGACARVGDVKSAEILFQEMIHSKNFKPRVPPYNTMMQLYTTTKPNRTSALYYYDEMKKARIRPSAHTYKLLLDTYGAIEPIDLRSMEKVFDELQDDRSVPLTGAHFASLINAYGCASKNFDKAISVFDSMSNIPRAPAPDAVVYEAIINVIVAHKRTELIPDYVSKMSEAGVHMTAYIANFLIKGYANVGDMDQARAIFESLLDPPTGMAAPNNHASHNPTESPEVPVMEPVYREPSTWEVMVRAELGAGNRDAAVDLLERLKARQYPEAVYNRISGVMTDHSVLV